MKDTLKEAQQELRENWEQGINCECCGQYVKLYRRRYNKTMAYGLIILYRLHQQHGFDKWFKMNEEITKLNIPSSNIEYSKNGYWDLMEQRGNSETTKKTSGLWRITNKGIDFLLGHIQIEAILWIFNNKARRKSIEKISYKDALDVKFNYEKLMNEFNTEKV
jgi:hypothetical protein